jgi:hypothetical protein
MKLAITDRQSDLKMRSIPHKQEEQFRRQLTEYRGEIFVTQEIARITEVILIMHTILIIQGTFMPV